MHGKNLIQLIKILDLMSRPQGCTKREIAEHLNISRKTVERKLEDVEELGVPVYDEKIPFEKQKHWRILPSYVDKLPNLTLPRVALSYSEIMSLYMMAGESVVFKGTEIDRQIHSALTRLMYFIPEETQKELSALKRIFLCKTMGSKTYQGKETIIQTLTESILDRRALTITYHVFYSDEVKKETIGPLHFFENNGGLFLFAVKLTDNEVRSYAVERIQRIKPHEQEFTYPEGFDPEARLNSAFDMIHGDPVSVKICFSNTVARYIKERQWAWDQTLEENDDGTLTLSMITSGYRDVKRWVMSFGIDAELLEPEQMKQEIVDKLEGILKKMRQVRQDVT